MVNKLVTAGIKFAAKKSGSALLKKVSDTATYIGDRTGLGSKPLNVGEEELLECYRKYPNTPDKCRAEDEKFKDNYHHPWRSKK
ncbi:MAG: hypothetical protein NC218_12160 [Acetobacter sp.]|nr:hypothetical protein [Acetobacter sp.]